MTTIFLASFARDLRKVRDRRLRKQIARAIEHAEEADEPEEIPQFKRLSGVAGFGRIRVGDWRLGVIIEGDTITFVRCLHRREVYRYFP